MTKENLTYLQTFFAGLGTKLGIRDTSVTVVHIGIWKKNPKELVIIFHWAIND